MGTQTQGGSGRVGEGRGGREGQLKGQCSWFTVLGFTVHDSQYTVHDLQFTVHDSRFGIHDSRFAVYDSRFTIRS